MTTMLLTSDVLAAFRRRRQAGERVSALAAEVGIPWQKLDKALRHPRPVTVPAPRVATSEPLTERYRPRTLAELLGQDGAVRLLTRYAAAPYPQGFLFEGPTGTGKTSAALALAAALGCDVQAAEFGGVWTIASGEQSADAVRETIGHLHQTPMAGSGWKVLIVNEADRMHAAAETIWLDRLEALPPKSTVIFTTNFAGKLSARFVDRCLRVTFTADPKHLNPAATKLLQKLWKAERGTTPGRATIDPIVAQAVQEGHLSFRRLVQLTQQHLMKEDA